jgi:hypothetical protein
VPLCRFHHLLLHNNHWEIQRIRGEEGFWLIPPPEIDPRRRPTRLHSKSPLLRQRERQRAG